MRARLRVLTLFAAAVTMLTAAVITGAVATTAAATTSANSSTSSSSTPIQVYGAWHCSDDACLWGTVRNMTDFDANNHWLIDRGDGHPSVNLVILSFVNPLKLLDGTTDSGDADGVPVGMTSAVVNYFTSHGIRVMLSIGGITYVSGWDSALSQNATLLGQKAATLATRLGVGIEIDYENSSSPNLSGLQSFITAYRSTHLRCGGCRSERAVDPGRRGRRPLADRPGPVRHRELAEHCQPGAGLRQRDGSQQAAVHQHRGSQLAGTRHREAELQPADPTAGPSEVHR